MNGLRNDEYRMSFDRLTNKVYSLCYHCEYQ